MFKDRGVAVPPQIQQQVINENEDIANKKEAPSAAKKPPAKPDPKGGRGSSQVSDRKQ